MQNLKAFLLKFSGSPGKISNIVAALQITQKGRNYQTLKICIIYKSLRKDYSASVQQLLHSKYWVLCLNALIMYFNNLCLTLTQG